MLLPLIKDIACLQNEREYLVQSYCAIDMTEDQTETLNATLTDMDHQIQDLWTEFNEEKNNNTKHDW